MRNVVSNNIFELKQLIEKRKERLRELHMAFIDLGLRQSGEREYAGVPKEEWS